MLPLHHPPSGLHQHGLVGRSACPPAAPCCRRCRPSPSEMLAAPHPRWLQLHRRRCLHTTTCMQHMQQLLPPRPLLPALKCAAGFCRVSIGGGRATSGPLPRASGRSKPAAWSYLLHRSIIAEEACKGGRLTRGLSSVGWWPVVSSVGAQGGFSGVKPGKKVVETMCGLFGVEKDV